MVAKRNENRTNGTHIRFTPHQEMMLECISKNMSISKTAIVHFCLDQFLEKYEKSKSRILRNS